ncbi:unnamed protein product [Paramecium primaurelia]|uniref:Uncharacterized protein n=1 Tax=Paramecium primaurelia TaxID=5886 RepID=A0A8S1LS98_PARPR|nr:unnamed protein product [Paramecium primaurelia]
MNLMDYTNGFGLNNYFYENYNSFCCDNWLQSISFALKHFNDFNQIGTTEEFFGKQFFYAFSLLGGDPYNYFNLQIEEQKIFIQICFVKWAIIDNADIGTIEAQSPQSNFEQITNLQSFNPGIYL